MDNLHARSARVPRPLQGAVCCRANGVNTVILSMHSPAVFLVIPGVEGGSHAFPPDTTAATRVADCSEFLNASTHRRRHVQLDHHARATPVVPRLTPEGIAMG